MRTAVVSAALAALVLVAAARAAIPGCSFRAGPYVYDMSEANSETFYNGTSGPYEFAFNICGNVRGMRACPGSLCQFYQGSLASVSAVWAAPEWSLVDPSDPFSGLTYSTQSGSACVIDGVKVPRTTVLQFPCVPGRLASGLTMTSVVANGTDCTATYVIPTSASCPGKA